MTNLTNAEINEGIAKGEYILCAAIMQDGQMYCGHRHHNIINLLWPLINPGVGPDSDVLGKPVNGKQGFMTSTGRFVDRREGLAIATAANQIIKKHGSKSELYSEDLY